MLSQKASLWFCHNFSHVLFLSRSKAVFYQSCERPEVYAWQAKPPAFKTTTTKKITFCVFQKVYGNLHIKPIKTR